MMKLGIIRRYERYNAYKCIEYIERIEIPRPFVQEEVSS